MTGIYQSYCIHGNPIHYSFCPGCRAMKQQQEAREAMMKQQQEQNQAPPQTADV